MKKRKTVLAIALAMGLTVPSTLSVRAAEDLEPYYKFGILDEEGDKFNLDNYGYSQDTILEYYPGSKEKIMIPKEYTQDKEQFKSAWIATIFNLHIDQPKNESDFKQMYSKRLNDFVDWNMNVMLFQIRPLLDAYYPSELNPTSQFLSGKQGVDVDYDPLEWMINETHEAGLEYHAWLNPYRVTNSAPSALTDLTDEEANQLTVPEYVALLAEEGVLAQDNFAVQHPELVMRYDGKLILNPGYPETIQHVLDSIDEIVTNYDVDAIHFDDCFYPYSTDKNREEFNKEDRDAFETYGLVNNTYEDSEAGLQEWRRDNVTNLIKDIQNLLKNHNEENKTAVQLGMSPFGIWEHYDNDPRGSHTPTSSSQSYSDQIFADTRKWVDEELLDYMLPQIYWEFNQPAAPYAELARWWNNVAENKNVDLYVGHAYYKHISNWGNSANWFNPELINKQIYFNQQFDNIKGSALYSYQHMSKTDTNNKTGYDYLKYETLNRAIDILKNDTFSVLPLTTEKPWLSHNNVQAVTDVKIEDKLLTIHDTVNDDARFYVVYKGTKGQSKEAITSDPQNIMEKIFASPNKNIFELTLDQLKADDVYYVSVLDRASMETEAIYVGEYGWTRIEGKWYYYDETGARTGWVKDKGTWYYLNDDGVMQTGWTKVRDSWYYLNSSGAMQTGWEKINNKWYYMNASGRMQTGWTKVSGSWYYMASNGVMQTGWTKVNNTWYYLNASGKMETGWHKIRGTWYYMNASGAMQTGWTKISGTWYYLAESGAMQTNWKKINGVWYYLNASGAMQTGWTKVNNTWYYLHGSGAMQTGWLHLNNHWYYLNSNGSMQIGTKVINGKTYQFHSSGRLL